jgi:cholesterol transport system auxiliary component
VVSVTACISLGPRTPSARYELQAFLEGEPVVGQGPVLVVAQPTAAPGFESPRIVYVKRPHELQAFARSEWVDTPARMLGPLLVRALERSGAFAAVTDAASGAAADLRLETELVRLQQEFTSHPSRVRLTLRVQLSDVRSRRVLGAREIETVEEAPSEDPYGGAVAANRAVRKVLEAVASFCGERFGEHRHRPLGEPPACLRFDWRDRLAPRVDGGGREPERPQRGRRHASFR